MEKYQEQLEFAVKLAQVKLSDLRAGDLLNLRDDLQSFFGRETLLPRLGRKMFSPNQPLDETFSLADFAALQKDIYAILSAMVTARDTGKAASVSREITAELIVSSRPAFKNAAFFSAVGQVRDMFLLQLFFLLGLEPIDRILRCKAPDCNRIFYRKRKQEFCSTRCTNRAYMKTYRKDATATAKEAKSKQTRQKGGKSHGN